MKKQKYFMFAASLAFGAAMTLSSCSKDNDKEDEPLINEDTTQKTVNPIPEAEEQSKVFTAYLNANLRTLAENLNFSSYEAVNKFAELFTSKLMSSSVDNGQTNIKVVLALAIGLSKEDANNDIAAKGYQYQSFLNLPEYFKYDMTITDGFKTTPSNDSHLSLTYKTSQNTNERITLKWEDNCKIVPMFVKQLSDHEYSENIGVVLEIPEKMNFTLSTDALTNEMQDIFSGSFSISFDNSKSFVDFFSDDWSISGTLKSNISATNTSIKEDAAEIEFNLTRKPSEKKSENTFSFVHNQKTVLAFSAKNSLINDAQPDLTDVKLSSAPVLDLLKALVGDSNIDELKINILDNCVSTIKLTDCEKALSIWSDSKTARRNYATKTEIDEYTKQLNEIISGTMELKSLNQVIPMNLQTIKFGVDYISMPSLVLGENDIVPLTSIIDLESIAYATNILDHSLDRVKETLIVLYRLYSLYQVVIESEETEDEETEEN